MELLRTQFWICGLAIVFLAGCGGEPKREVVVYASQDRVYAEQILNDFSEETGIVVKPVYDSEAVKAVGLAKRLLTEWANPQCDLFGLLWRMSWRKRRL